MASSSSSKALSLVSLPGPLPTPTSLMGLPEPWLLKLATCKGLGGQRDTLLALFRTCTFFRDAVARHRIAQVTFHVPIAAEDFPAEVERLCTVARRSSSVRLWFEGQRREEDEEPPEDGPMHPWTETEPRITHLLVCAMAQLEGERPLACVKEIHLCAMEQTSLVPPWVKVLCPNATKLDQTESTLVPHPLHQPRPLQHLQHLSLEQPWNVDGDPPLAAHMREQLAALPSLTSLAFRDMGWAAEEEDGEQQQEDEEDEQQAGRLISGAVMRLELTFFETLEDSTQVLWRLPTQFPNLRELRAPRCIAVDDDGLEALLRLPHLRRLHVLRFSLERDHSRVAPPWAHLRVGELDVGSFARLPLDGIQACSGWWRVVPSADAAAVARVAQAMRRWGGVRRVETPDWWLDGRNAAALVATVGPLVAALPAEQQRHVTIRHLEDATPQQVQQLGQELPAGVARLRFMSSTLPLDACSALLPGLPATVEELGFLCAYPHLTEQKVLALCRAAMRPIRVVVDRHSGLSEQDRERIRASLVGPDGQPGLVTLVGS